MKVVWLATLFVLLTLNFETFACDLGSYQSADKKVSVRIIQSSVECAGAGADTPATFYSGDTVALEIKVMPIDPVVGVNINKIELLTPRGLKSKTIPRIRMLSAGLFFADNIEFNLDGTWTLTLALHRGAKSEVIKVSIPVKPDPHQSSKAVKDVKVPDFNLQDPQGRTFSMSDMRNKVWVVDFFFASCPHVCPMMTQKMAALQKEFGGHPDFRLVSVTTDPKRDTPEALTAYAKNFKADTKSWYFLRGEKKDVVALSKNGLGLGAEADSIMHSTRFAIVDRSGIVKGTFDSDKREEFSQLKVMLKELLSK